MKKLLLFTLATSLMVACKHGETNSKEADNEGVKDSTEVTVEPLPAVTESVEDAPATEEVVKERALHIYTQVLATYADEQTDWEKAKKTRETFLSEHMKLLITSCETMQEVTGELIFDYDYWINAQDFGDLQLKGVKVLSCTDEKAEVEVCFSNFGEKQVQTLILVYEKEKQNWFIDDFQDRDGTSFRHYLEHLL